jgi:hypothetical protein
MPNVSRKKRQELVNKLLFIFPFTVLQVETYNWLTIL